MHCIDQHLPEKNRILKKLLTMCIFSTALNFICIFCSHCKIVLKWTRLLSCMYAIIVKLWNKWANKLYLFHIKQGEWPVCKYIFIYIYIYITVVNFLQPKIRYHRKFSCLYLNAHQVELLAGVYNVTEVFNLIG